jgi:hypothetical protein
VSSSAGESALLCFSEQSKNSLITPIFYYFFLIAGKVGMRWASAWRLSSINLATQRLNSLNVKT